jgi:hypothetical protein
VRDNTGTAFGREHGFESVRDVDAFRRRVPVRAYDDLAPWIDRVAVGEQGVLTAERVTRLIPSSGSTRATKLIPYTAGLQREFNRAIGPWIADLYRRWPDLTRGCAYWSISPITAKDALAGNGRARGAVPVGFDEDSAYLGGVRRRLVDAVMAVPGEVRRAPDMPAFQLATLTHLLRRRDLRLISVWHPSFLELLLDAATQNWDELLHLVGRDDAVRAAELRAASPDDWNAIWPHLGLISCWADASAAGPADALRARVPNIFFQPKGLLATEAFVSIPFAGRWPLAVRSHFLEFEDDHGRMLLADELRPGGTYAVIVTTAGGLWRYRLGDLVRCDGVVGRTPSVRFVGRADLVVDRFGEKLSEGFVGATIHGVLAAAGIYADFAMLAPDVCDTGAETTRYTLFLSATSPQYFDGGVLAASLDRALRSNPHYAYCRDLGQLGPPRFFHVRAGARATYLGAITESGRRIGEIKPVALDGRTDWARRFHGDYVGGDGT